MEHSLVEICSGLALTTVFILFIVLTSDHSFKMPSSSNSSRNQLMRYLTAPLRHALFDARVTAPLLVALLYYPDKLRSILPPKLHPWISSLVVVRTLKITLGLSLTTRLSKTLSRLAANNFHADAKFIKSQEIVLISGGCSGIGLEMVKFFAVNGVKVVIMDLNPPQETLRQSPMLNPCSELTV
jgi:all-trans-retinol dehydrogenase (NAD+)